MLKETAKYAEGRAVMAPSITLYPNRSNGTTEKVGVSGNGACQNAWPMTPVAKKTAAIPSWLESYDHGRNSWPATSQ